MKKLVLVFLAATLIAPAISAKDESHREKRLRAKNSFKVDSDVADRTLRSDPNFNETKREKTLRAEVQPEKRLRSDKLGRELVLKKVPPSKVRKKTHFREWP